LQQDAEAVADVVGAEFGEAFRAVAALEQKGLALGYLGQPFLEPTRLACKNQRRQPPQLLLGGLQLGGIPILRNLPDRQLSPAIAGPFLGHV
jgi:hypothetical protein